MVCRSCKKQIDNNSSFCIYCGATTNVRKINPSAKIFIFICCSLIMLSFIMPIIRTIGLSFTKVLDTQEFIEYMENENCILINDLDTNENKNIDFHYKTDPTSCPYEISYYIINDDYTKYSIYENIKNEIHNYKNININESISSINYYLDLSEGSNYTISILNDNSIIYIKTNIKNKDKVLNILNDLGYNMHKLNDSFIENQLKFIAAMILVIVTWWKINNKIGRKGYICLIPIYNIICLSKDVLGSIKYCLLLLIPIVNAVFIAVLFYNLGKSFGQSKNYSILMALLPIIFIPIIAFDDSKYIGSAN